MVPCVRGSRPPSGRNMRPCRPCWRSDGAGCGPPRKPRRSGTAASRKWRGRRGSSRRPFSAACVTSRLASRSLGRGSGRPGGGRKRATDLDATLLRDLDALVEPTAPGDPDSPLRWTCLSARTLAVALDGLGHHVSHTVVAELLHGLGYSLQGNVEDARRAPTRRSGRPVSLHRAPRARGASARSSRRSRWIRRRKSSSGTQECRPRVAPGEIASPGARA